MEGSIIIATPGPRKKAFLFVSLFLPRGPSIFLARDIDGDIYIYLQKVMHARVHTY